MDARDKLRTNRLTQRASQSSVGYWGAEYAEELDKFMEHSMEKYGMTRDSAMGLVIHYMLTYNE